MLAGARDDTGGFLNVAGLRVESPDRIAPLAAEQLGRNTTLAIVATNQSGIARGIISLTEYEAVAARTAELLAEGGGRIDAQFFCPHAPEISGHCDCRKPDVGLYRQADARFAIDLARSVWIGDRMRDIEPARTLGGTGILVRTGLGASEAPAAAAAGYAVVADVDAAVERALGG